jgi:glycine betaine catabolism A
VTTETKFYPTLPGRYYYDPELYAKEQEQIWSQMWVCVGRADAIPNSGQFLNVTVGNESVLVVRGRDGELRAMLNVCRHRGARLCTESAGQLRNTIQCKYHAWTYALDGTLLGAPNVMQNEEFDRAQYGLVPVALDVWEGLIWINLSDNPGPAREQIEAPIIKRFGSTDTWRRWNIGSLAVGKRIEYDVAANWKVTVENFMECYHCGPMHPELCKLVPDFKNGRSYQGLVGQGTPMAADAAGFTLSGEATRPRLPGLLDEDDRLYYGLVLWPNVFVSLVPDHVILHTAFPTGPETTHVVCDWLFDPHEIAKPDFDPQDAVEVFDIVNKQDWEVCELTQQGMRSRAYNQGGVFVPSEHHIIDFNRMVRDKLGLEQI